MKEFLLTFYNETYIVILYLILLVIIGVWKFRQNTEEKSIFTCENLFMMFYYVFIALGPVYLVLFKNYTYNYNIFFICLVGIVSFIIGADIIIGDRKIKKFSLIGEKRISKAINFENVSRNAKVILCVAYLCGIIYLAKNIGYIMQDFENNRVLAMQGSGVIIHFSYLMLPATWILYYCHLNYKKNKYIIVIFIIDSILFMLIGFRSRIIELLLVAIIIKNDKKRFSLRKLFRYGIILIILVSILQIARTYLSNGELESGIDSIINTMAVGSINLKQIFQAFPSRVPFQYGYTYLLSITILLPSSSMDATLWLKEALGMKFDGGGVTPTIIGELFINFGYIGIFVGLMLIGILCRLIDKYGISNNSNRIIYFIISFYVARSVGSGISNFIILLSWFTIVTYFIFKLNSEGLIGKINNVKENINENILKNNNEIPKDK